MSSKTPSYQTYGRTEVMCCCTFEWYELDGCRMVRLPTGFHERCLEELRRAALHVGVKLQFSHEDFAA
jgi:hypothetical protein